jgi:hypothetical protein
MTHGLGIADALARDLLTGPHKDVLRRAYGAENVDIAADRLVTRARAERAALIARSQDPRRDFAQMCFMAQYRDAQESFHAWAMDRLGVTQRERLAIARAHLSAMQRARGGGA